MKKIADLNNLLIVVILPFGNQLQQVSQRILAFSP